MNKYFMLSFDRGQFYLNQFEAEDTDKANEIFEEEQTNCSSDWLLDENDFKKLLFKIKNFEIKENKIKRLFIYYFNGFRYKYYPIGVIKK